MILKLKALRNAWFLIRNFALIRKCTNIIENPRGVINIALSEHLSLEMMEGVMEMERFGRMMELPYAELKKDIKELKKSLDG